MANPGSWLAVRKGCECPVLDNRYGEGAVVNGHVDPDQFYVSPFCPIHTVQPLKKPCPKNGHFWDLQTESCATCGMTKEQIEDARF
jgi:hypothetical protein